MQSDLEIARKASLKPISEIAAGLGIREEEIEPYGRYKAKVSLDILGRLDPARLGRYIDVTAVTPTPLGEGKTVTTIGLSQALAAAGRKVLTCIRQPSLGPVFGIKGGAAGGGYAQVVPMEDFNLHLTGDVHAVGLAHNLLAAFIDNSLYHGNPLEIEPSSVSWPRVLDVSDRALRNIVIGLGNKEDGVPRQSSFEITVASEVMAILALADSLPDLRARLGRIVIGRTRRGRPVTAEQLKVAGAMCVLLRDALKPTLMQTLENTPCLVHAGPFANIAHGNSSLIADMIALRLADYVVTESGFGADCGAEKFFNIKCRVGGLKPDAAVIVCTVRALKAHSGRFRVVPGRPIPPEMLVENLAAIREGGANLVKHVENVRAFGIPCVVAVNRFVSDTDAEIALVREIALAAGADDACPSDVWAGGGPGGAELAEAVARAAEKGGDFRYLYPLEMPIREKIETIATRIYGAGRVEFSAPAEEKIRTLTRSGHDRIPVCMAKTHLSLSHDPKLKGAPRGFTLPVRDIRLSAGAGFLQVLCGEMRTMPGLPARPAGENIDIDERGEVTGLF